MAEITVAGGCFWCLDAAYRQFRGVTDVLSVYTGGQTTEPTYEEVCTGRTGHAEAVTVKFDADTISEDVLLDAFFTMHDPTQLNRQGHDVGTQYRSAMFAVDQAQMQRFSMARGRAAEWWPGEVVTTIEMLGDVWPAEDKHQDFFAKNPGQGYCLAVAVPKVNKIRAEFTQYMIG